MITRSERHIGCSVLVGLTASLLCAQALHAVPAANPDATALMREIETRFRARPRAVRMDVATTRVARPGVVDLFSLEPVRIWGVTNGDADRTAMLFVFTSPRKLRGTGLMLEDHRGQEAGDAMWYQMRTFRQFQVVPPTSLKLLVPGTCLTYEDARGFLAGDRYTFKFDRPELAVAGKARILARPRTSELKHDTGYESLVVTVDLGRRFVERIEYTGSNGRLRKVMEAMEPARVGDFWIARKARIRDLDNSITSVVTQEAWPLDSQPPATLFSTQGDDVPLLDRFVGTLAAFKLRVELDPQPGPDVPPNKSGGSSAGPLGRPARRYTP